jgi:threonine dehydratase
MNTQHHGRSPVNPTLADIEAAAQLISDIVPATPQYRWPQLCERIGAEVWVKHENCTPIGAFKIRGGLVYFDRLSREQTQPAGVVTATRGNHGQSIGFAARRYGIPATIVVPHGNSREKNAAMRALGVDLIEHGDDFQAAHEHAQLLATTRGLHMIPAFHPLLVLGVATYSLELLRSVADLDVVYVPIGLGSSICGMIAARDALGLETAIVGVVSSQAPAYARSFEEGQPVSCPVTTRLADGMAVRTPDPQALEIIRRGVDRLVEVSDAEVGAAMRTIFECIHHVAEGAGAAAMAAAMQERTRIAGQRVGVVLSGGNVDREVFAGVLAGS